jgi:hypothetical protein
MLVNDNKAKHDMKNVIQLYQYVVGSISREEG